MHSTTPLNRVTGPRTGWTDVMQHDPREEKLPQWVRDILAKLRARSESRDYTIRELRKQVEELEAAAESAALTDTGPADSDAQLYRETPTGETLAPLGLGKDALVTFMPTGEDGAQFNVHVKGSGIEVNSTADLLVIPMSRGTLRIQPVTAKITE